jgi:hypothetical protein
VRVSVALGSLSLLSFGSRRPLALIIDRIRMRRPPPCPVWVQKPTSGAMPHKVSKGRNRSSTYYVAVLNVASSVTPRTNDLVNFSSLSVSDVIVRFSSGLPVKFGRVLA